MKHMNECFKTELNEVLQTVISEGDTSTIKSSSVVESIPSVLSTYFSSGDLPYQRGMMVHVDCML